MKAIKTSSKPAAKKLQRTDKLFNAKCHVKLRRLPMATIIGKSECRVNLTRVSEATINRWSIKRCRYVLPNGQRCSYVNSFGPLLVKHQLQHQNDLPCGCYRCLEENDEEEEKPLLCDYVFPDLKLACGHRDVDEPAMRAHKNKMNHFAFSYRNGQTRFQCSRCKIYFNYQCHFKGHPCVVTPFIKSKFYEGAEESNKNGKENGDNEIKTEDKFEGKDAFRKMVREIREAIEQAKAKKEIEESSPKKCRFADLLYAQYLKE